MKKQNQSMRITRFISSSGVCARRKAIELIQNNKVTVNNKQIKDPSFMVCPKTDHVKVHGRTIQIPERKVYIAFHKPEKVITSMNDPKNRPCIADYLKKSKHRLFPVGRLDWNSRGLILLTNDGNFSMKVLHPSHKVSKTYLVKLNGRPLQKQLTKLEKGVHTVLGRIKALYAKPVRGTHTKHIWIKVIIMEGKNRQLHRMFEKIGFQIKTLKRVAIGKLKLGSLRPGEFIFLRPQDIQKIFTTPSELMKLIKKKTKPLNNLPSKK